jgi:hypothetical protein
MMRATDLAHLLMRQSLKAGDWAVDATVGNGHDTALLAECVGPSGRVFGFDVQQEALTATAKRVRSPPQVTLIHAGHETLAEHLPAEGRGRLAAVMFNLGYLPGGSKAVVTRTQTTLAALEQALGNLAVRGLVTLVLYPGHPGGDEEAAAVRAYAKRLAGSFAVTHHVRINAMRPAPELIVMERLA